MFIKDQRGAALPLVLSLAVFFVIMILGLIPLMTYETRATARNENQLIAQYTAEAGAKWALLEVRKQLEANTSPGSITLPATAGQINSSTKAFAINLKNVTTSPGNGYIQIDSTASHNNLSTTIPVRVYYTETGIGGSEDVAPVVKWDMAPTSLAYLFNEKTTYSEKGSWKITEGSTNPKNPKPAVARPKDGGRYQVMFDNPCKSNELLLAYNAACKPLDMSNGAGAGYGIYYGAHKDSNANKMKAYVFQYDPGAREAVPTKYKKEVVGYEQKLDKKTGKYVDDKSKPIYKDVPIAWTYKDDGGSFFVKKHIMDLNGTAMDVGRAEWNTIDKWDADQRQNWATPFQQPRAGEVMRVSLNDVKKLMDNWYKTNDDPTDDHEVFNINGDHCIIISVKKDDDGVLRHRIFIDKYPHPILYFTDHSDEDSKNDPDNYVVKDFTGTKTGLRVWNVDVNFYAYPVEIKEGGSAGTSPGYTVSFSRVQWQRGTSKIITGSSESH